MMDIVVAIKKKNDSCIYRYLVKVCLSIVIEWQMGVDVKLYGGLLLSS